MKYYERCLAYREDKRRSVGFDSRGATMRGARLHGVDLTGADFRDSDLSMAELHDSRLTSAQFTGAQLTGTIIRKCAINGIEFTDAHTYRTEILLCTPAPQPSDGLLLAPLPADAQRVVRDLWPLRPLTGHTGRVWSVAWSPDGTQLLTGGTDGARVWDATTGQPVGFTMFSLPDGELAVFDAVSGELVGASPGAWRWLGWTIIQNGRLDQLPAETFGPLPPLRSIDPHRSAISE
jgi:hypothetical protein